MSRDFYAMREFPIRIDRGTPCSTNASGVCLSRKHVILRRFSTSHDPEAIFDAAFYVIISGIYVIS